MRELSELNPIPPSDPVPSGGKVWVVGAGPGAPDLITLRGQRCLAAADGVFYTGSLVPAALLDHCRPEADCIDTRSLTLEEWLPELGDRAAAGQTVVRLQDGDPSLYGALHEVAAVLGDRQIPFEVVPGVSAFQAAAALLGAELTIPNLVQTIILTRASGAASAVPEPEQLANLAAHRASLCLYLSARHCGRSQQDLLTHYPADTPIALCYRLGWPDQEIHLARLDQMADLTRQTGLDRTVLYLISPALNALETNPAARSLLYSANHGHLFRPKSRL